MRHQVICSLLFPSHPVSGQPFLLGHSDRNSAQGRMRNGHRYQYQIAFFTAVPLTKKKLSKQTDVAGIDQGGSNPRHELGSVA